LDKKAAMYGALRAALISGKIGFLNIFERRTRATGSRILRRGMVSQTRRHAHAPNGAHTPR
jgi:hypothetical protein